MSFAVRLDGLGWRAVSSEADCMVGEVFASSQPALVQEAGVVATVTMRQARLALLSIGKLGDVDTVINAMPEPQRTAAKIEWDYAASVEKSSPLIQTLAPQIGINEAQLTELFNAAALL